MVTPGRIPASQKVGHLAGVLAYGVVKTSVTTIGALAETLLGGLATTGKEMVSEWGKLSAPAFPVPQMQTQVVPVPPVTQRTTGGRGGAPKRQAAGNP